MKAYGGYIATSIRGPPIIETKSGLGYTTMTHSCQVIPQIRCKYAPKHCLWGWLPEPQLLFSLLGYSFSLLRRLCIQQQVQCLQYSRRVSWLQQTELWNGRQCQCRSGTTHGKNSRTQWGDDEGKKATQNRMVYKQPLHHTDQPVCCCWSG